MSARPTYPVMFRRSGISTCSMISVPYCAPKSSDMKQEAHGPQRSPELIAVS